jgi:hypothetical protein
MPMRAWNEYISAKPCRRPLSSLSPNYGFEDYLKNATLEELGGKTIISPPWMMTGWRF